MSNDLAQLISDLLRRNPEALSPISAGVLAAAHCGVSSDSRSFAQKLGLAHALVLRECVALADEQKLIALQDRTERSQRLFFTLTQRGRDLLAATGAR